MPFPTVDEFKQLVRTEAEELIVRTVLFQQDTFFFRPWPEGLAVLRTHIAHNLGVDPASICVVGSGKLGFSIKPTLRDFGRPFRAKSDIDVVVVSERLFDAAWTALLRWHYPHPWNDASEAELRWESDQRQDVYRGYLYPPALRVQTIGFPTSLIPVRDLRAAWLAAINGLSSIDSRFAARDIKSRLYRTWDHAMLYHAFGIRKLRELL